MPNPAPIPGPAGAAGAAGAPGPAPAGTGLVSVTAGVLDTPSTLVARLTADAANCRSALGVSPGPVTYYASDCIAENGSDTASISGTGPSSTFTLTITGTPRTYGSGGSTAPRIVCVLPAGTQEATIEIGITSVTGMSTGGNKCLVMALRNAADGAAPSILWGASFPDQAGGVFYNNLLAGGNAGVPSSSTAQSPTSAGKWFRVTLQPRVPFLSVQTGAGSGGARPTAWAAAPTPAPLQTNANSVSCPDMNSATAVVITLVSHGTANTNSVTGTLAIRVVPQ